MRVVLQRVESAQVTVDGEAVGAIGRGALLLVGFRPGDDVDATEWMAEKVRGLRIFPDRDGKMNLSVEEADGALLVVSQFTLYGDARKGRRPSFVEAASPNIAIPLYDHFVEALRRGPCPVETGIFGAMMDVSLVNHGPVTLILDR